MTHRQPKAGVDRSTSSRFRADRGGTSSINPCNPLPSGLDSIQSVTIGHTQLSPVNVPSTLVTVALPSSLLTHLPIFEKLDGATPAGGIVLSSPSVPLGMEQIRQGLLKCWIAKFKAFTEQSDGVDSLPFEEHVAEFPQDNPEDKRGNCRQDDGTIEGLSQDLCEFAVSNRIGCHTVDRSRQAVMFQGEQHDIGQILLMYPWKPLTPIAERAPKPFPKSRDHLGQSTALFAQDNPKAAQHHPNSTF